MEAKLTEAEILDAANVKKGMMFVIEKKYSTDYYIVAKSEEGKIRMIFTVINLSNGRESEFEHYYSDKFQTVKIRF